MIIGCDIRCLGAMCLGGGFKDSLVFILGGFSCLAVQALD